MSDELMPCPFCGGEATYQPFGVVPWLLGRVICSCGAEIRQGRGESRHDVVRRWNASARVVEERRDDG